jgi:lipid II:glycine glycyltransferase (peptidoglycan interpeptide bridge formation enzyme)
LSRILSLDLSALNPEQLLKFRGSALYGVTERSYFYSPGEERFQSAYHESETFQPFNRVFFVDDEPSLLVRSQIRNGRLSYWGRPAKIFRLPMLLPQNLRLIQGQLKEELAKQSVQTMTLEHDDAALSAFWDARISTSFDARGSIDLTQSEENISASVRRSYKSLINWGRNNLTVQIVNQANLTNEAIDQFRDFHIRVAGRQTRSQKTWDVQRELIQENSAFVVNGFLDTRLVSSILILYGKTDAVYGVAVNDRALMADKKPIGHWPLFRAILEAKTIGMKTFDLGPINTPEGSDDKENNIAKFKKGFCELITSTAQHEFSFT